MVTISPVVKSQIVHPNSSAARWNPSIRLKTSDNEKRTIIMKDIVTHRSSRGTPSCPRARTVAWKSKLVSPMASPPAARPALRCWPYAEVKIASFSLEPKRLIACTAVYWSISCAKCRSKAGCEAACGRVIWILWPNV